MARCPKCGKWIWFTPAYLEEHVCPGCGAALKRKVSLAGLFLGYVSAEDDLTAMQRDLGVPGLPKDKQGRTNWFYNDSRSSDEEPNRDEAKSSLRGAKAKWGNCDHCDAVIMISNSKFCSNCGASLRRGLKDATQLGMEGRRNLTGHAGATEDRGAVCMVCNLELNEGDDVLWCPHCGDPAHKMHLIEWIHVKRRCPICGEHLSEQELQ